MIATCEQGCWNPGDMMMDVKRQNLVIAFVYKYDPKRGYYSGVISNELAKNGFGIPFVIFWEEGSHFKLGFSIENVSQNMIKTFSILLGRELSQEESNDPNLIFYGCSFKESDEKVNTVIHDLDVKILKVPQYKKAG